MTADSHLFPYDPDQYPEGHSPFCPRDCDDPGHDAYDRGER